MRGFGLLRGKPGPFPGVDSLMSMLEVIWENLSGGRDGGGGRATAVESKPCFALPNMDCALAHRPQFPHALFH